MRSFCELGAVTFVSGRLVIAGDNVAEHRPDVPAFLVTLFVGTDDIFVVLETRDQREAVLATQGGSEPVGIIIAIGSEPLYSCGIPDWLIRRRHVRGVARRESKAQRSVENVDECMDSCRRATSRKADRSGICLPFHRLLSDGP